MNAKLLLKTVFLMAILLLLVVMGMHNRSSVSFALPPLVPRASLPAAIMYFSFFALGVLTGMVAISGGKKGSGGGSSKPPKSSK